MVNRLWTLMVHIWIFSHPLAWLGLIRNKTCTWCIKEENIPYMSLIAWIEVQCMSARACVSLPHGPLFTKKWWFTRHVRQSNGPKYCSKFYCSLRTFCIWCELVFLTDDGVFVGGGACVSIRHWASIRTYTWYIMYMVHIPQTCCIKTTGVHDLIVKCYTLR